MEKLKQWVALTVVAVLAVLAAGWFLLVSPKRSDAEALNAQTVTSESDNQVLQTQLASLKAQAKDEPAQEAKIAAVVAKIPDNPALPKLIRDLTKASDTSGIDITTLSPGLPTLVAVPVAAPAKAATPAGAAPSASGATSASRVTVTPAGAVAAGNLASIAVNITISGTYFQMLEFVDNLEGLTRAFKVTGLVVSPVTDKSSTTSKITATVSGNIYMAAGRLPVAAVKIPKTGK